MLQILVRPPALKGSGSTAKVCPNDLDAACSCDGPSLPLYRCMLAGAPFAVPNGSCAQAMPRFRRRCCSKWALFRSMWTTQASKQSCCPGDNPTRLAQQHNTCNDKAWAQDTLCLIGMQCWHVIQLVMSGIPERSTMQHVRAISHASGSRNHSQRMTFIIDTPYSQGDRVKHLCQCRAHQLCLGTTNAAVRHAALRALASLAPRFCEPEQAAVMVQTVSRVPACL